MKHFLLICILSGLIFTGWACNPSTSPSSSGSTLKFYKDICEAASPLKIDSPPLAKTCSRKYEDADKHGAIVLLDEYLAEHPPKKYVKELLDRYKELWDENFDDQIKGSEIKIFKAKAIDTTALLCAQNLSPELGKINISSTGEPFKEKSDEAFADFANKLIGGGVLHGGFVQEEIMMIKSTFLPFVAEVQIKRQERKGVSWCPAISLSNLDEEPLTLRFGLVWDWIGEYARIEDPAKNLIPNPPRKDIYAIAMAAKDFRSLGASSKYYQIKDIENMVLTATRAFYETMLALDSDGLPLILNTGNWGAGVFDNSIAMAWGMQRLAIQSAYELFKKATGKDPGLVYRYSAYDEAGEQKVKKAKQAYEARLKDVKSLAQGIEALYALSQEDAAWQVVPPKARR